MTFDSVAYKKAYRAKNAERIRIADREYRKKNREAINAYNRAYRSANGAKWRREYYRKWNKDHFAERKVYARKSNLKRIYGLTQEAYDDLLKSQNGVCGICGGPKPPKDFAVDHNHETGEVRGLLCDKCNLGIGLFDDSADRLLDAIAYLKKRRT